MDHKAQGVRCIGMELEEVKRLEKLVEEVKSAEKALEDLLKMLARLKESGVLDMLENIAKQYEELLEAFSSDQRIYHALAALQAMLEGLRSADPWKLKPSVRMATECLVSALDPEKLTLVKPIGILGLLKALRDPDVGYGLALLLAAAKSIGACMRQRLEKAGQPG